MQNNEPCINIALRTRYWYFIPYNTWYWSGVIIQRGAPLASFNFCNDHLFLQIWPGIFFCANKNHWLLLVSKVQGELSKLNNWYHLNNSNNICQSHPYIWYRWTIWFIIWKRMHTTCYVNIKIIIIDTTRKQPQDACFLFVSTLSRGLTILLIMNFHGKYSNYIKF